MNVRESEQIMREGYMVIPFPESLKDLMRNHIRSYIVQTTGIITEDLTEAVMSLSDDQFVKLLGTKAFRMFSRNVADEINRWAMGLASFLGGARTGINYVSVNERNTNQNLQEDSLDTFWRCVRPGKADVGAAHADYQFWELAKGTDEEARVPFHYHERWKIWVPLIGCNHSNSLQMIPGSHNEDFPVTLRTTKFGIRPDIDADWLKANENRFICPFKEFSGSCVLFHDKLVHRGPPNNSDMLRMSGELTILLSLAPRGQCLTKKPLVDTTSSGILSEQFV